MAYYRDLRDYMAALEAAGKLIRVKRAINKDTQLSPLVRLQYRGLPEEDRRAFLFENVTGSKGQVYTIPVAIGALAGSRDIYALGMRCRPEEVSEKLAHAEMKPLAPRLISSGPVQEVVHQGKRLLDHGGLSEFPIPLATPGFDPAPYITAPYWVTKDPETGTGNMGMYRAMVKSPTRTGLNFASPTKGAAVHLQKCKARGIHMQAAIVVGGPPCLGYVAVSPVPRDVDELSVAGAIAGEPLEVVRCKTVDLTVPAYAEIIIEGEVDPNLVEPEAPFGESYGFVGPMDMNPFFNITCITHRRNPIWLATISQYPPSESTKMRQLGNQGTVYRHLRYTLGMTHVLDVAFYEEASSGRVVGIKVDGSKGADIMRTLEETARRIPSAKIIVAVDKDVNVHDIGSVVLAIGMRTQPYRDYRIQKFPTPILSDYSLEPLDKLTERSLDDPDRPLLSRMLIDTTMKWPWPPVSLPKREFMDDAIRIWQEEGMPGLKLAEPWSGTNLGYWSDEHEQHARAAVAGDYYRAGSDYERRRRPA